MPAEMYLQAWNQAAVEVPLRFSGGVAAAELRCLTGASGVHVVLTDGEAVRLRAEVAAEPGEIVPLRVEVEPDGVLSLSSRGRDVVHLPADARYHPPAPIVPAKADAPIDIAIIVDGTTRIWPETPPAVATPQESTSPSATRLLERTDAWSAHAEKLIAFVMQFAEGRYARVAVLAFGDQNPPTVTARDLQPRYQLFPSDEERVFHRLDETRLRERLLALPATPGADFVDATADALDACARLWWRNGARRIALLTGDSPGASILYPLPKSGDLGVRRHDVDTRAVELHRMGVEILTIYHPPPSSLGLQNLAPQRDFLRCARDQYQRLASSPELAFLEASFDPAAAVELIGRATVVARGASLGQLISSETATPARHRSAR
ncbi:MAG TPA: hypothetical protein VF846_09235 [Thermoanaerobaculia bacterium]